MHPNDFGPIYAETLPGLGSGAFPVEPWNTWTNLIFVALLFHIAYSTRLDRRSYPLVVMTLPIIAIGIIGGTAYHATRSHPVWLFMDFVPIIIATSVAGVVFWREIAGSWARAVLLFLLVGLSGRMLGFAFVTERTIQISLGYVSAALAILIPLVLIVRRANWNGLGLLCGVIVAFSTAITCRMLDRPGIESPLPMGTHFLWHIFGGIAVWALMLLIIRLKDAASALSRNSAHSGL